MSGRKIEDKGGWPGSSDAMMKSKNHNKEYHSAEGVGAFPEYPDTTEKILSGQKEGDRQASRQKMKAGYRY